MKKRKRRKKLKEIKLSKRKKMEKSKGNKLFDFKVVMHSVENGNKLSKIYVLCLVFKFFHALTYNQELSVDS